MDPPPPAPLLISSKQVLLTVWVLFYGGLLAKVITLSQTEAWSGGEGIFSTQAFIRVIF